MTNLGKCTYVGLFLFGVLSLAVYKNKIQSHSMQHTLLLSIYTGRYWHKLLNLEIVFFHQTVASILLTLPHVTKIEWFFTEIWQQNYFHNGSHLPLWIFKILTPNSKTLLIQTNNIHILNWLTDRVLWLFCNSSQYCCSVFGSAPDSEKQRSV